MIKKVLVMVAAAATVISCSQGVSKKVLIIGKGEIRVEGNTITMIDKLGYTEETVDVSSEEAVTWDVKTPSGNSAVTVPAEQGLYILNLRADTLVGSKQELGKDLSNARQISQEQLKLMIDSLKQLTVGANVVGGKSYFLSPKEIEKISDNSEAKVFGPFTKIPRKLEAGKDGKAPELYKFYTNSEMRDLIKNFTEMTH